MLGLFGGRTAVPNDFYEIGGAKVEHIARLVTRAAYESAKANLYAHAK